MLAATRLAATHFTGHLIRANSLDGGFDEWVLYPGMLFQATAQWWGDGSTRRTPHEGLDLCFYRGQGGEIQCLDEHTQIPALYEGTVAGTIPDLLGTSVILRHPIAGDGTAVLLTMYGHTNPRGNLHAGMAVGQGEIIATLARARSGRAVRPHLHLSIAIASRDVGLDGLTWKTIGDSDTMTLLDPLPAIDRICVVPDAARPGCGAQ